MAALIDMNYLKGTGRPPEGTAATPVPTPFTASMCVDIVHKCDGIDDCRKVPVLLSDTMDSRGRIAPLKVYADTQAENNSSDVILISRATTFFSKLSKTVALKAPSTVAVNIDIPGSCVVHSMQKKKEWSRDLDGDAQDLHVDHIPYGAVLLYINGVWKRYQNSKYLELNLRDDFRILVRAVGNVTASNARYTCVTDYACKHTLHDAPIRYVRCSLRTPVKLSDNGTSLIIPSNNKRFTIIVTAMPSPSLAPYLSMKSMSTQTVTTTVTVHVCLFNSSTNVHFGMSAHMSEQGIIVWIIMWTFLFGVVIVLVAIIIIKLYCVCMWGKNSHLKISIKYMEEGTMLNNTKSVSCAEKQVLINFYSKLVIILPVDNILYKLVSAKIITMNDAAKINRKPRSKDKASIILNIIDNSLEAGFTESFYTLLDMMEESDKDDLKVLVKNMRRALMIVFSSSCPHCDQFHDEIRRHGYNIKTVPTKTDASGNMLRTSLDQGIPLITCSCSDCEIPREVAQLLRNSTMPDSWNVLQLHQNSDRYLLEYDRRVKVIQNRKPVDEVLDWLETKLPRRPTTSVDGQ